MQRGAAQPSIPGVAPPSGHPGSEQALVTKDIGEHGKYCCGMVLHPSEQSQASDIPRLTQHLSRRANKSI